MSTSTIPPVVVEEEFISVSYKKPIKSIKKNRKGKQQQNKRIEKTLIEKLLTSKTTLDSSNYLNKCTKLLKEALNISSNEVEGSISIEDEAAVMKEVKLICPIPICIVCLGLGNISDSFKSRDQYNLLKTLMKDLNESSSRKPLIYDPVFNKEDIEQFELDQIEVLTKEHDLIFNEPTLIYMPHCPKTLFNEILKKNWNQNGLKNLIILGNRLDIYNDSSQSTSTSTSKSPFLTKAAPLFNIIPLPIDSNYFDVFNDLALEWIPIEILEGLEESFWKFDDSLEEEELVVKKQ